MTDEMDKAAREWLKAREIIAAFLAELIPSMPRAANEHNAAAILARLAKENLLIEEYKP